MLKHADEWAELVFLSIVIDLKEGVSTRLSSAVEDVKADEEWQAARVDLAEAFYKYETRWKDFFETRFAALVLERKQATGEAVILQFLRAGC